MGQYVPKVTKILEAETRKGNSIFPTNFLGRSARLHAGMCVGSAYRNLPAHILWADVHTVQLQLRLGLLRTNHAYVINLGRKAT